MFVFNEVLFFILVGFLYEYIIYGFGLRNIIVLFVVFNFIVYVFFGIYFGIVIGVILVVEFFINLLFFVKKLWLFLILCVCFVYFIIVVLLLWWIILVLVNYEYMGGLFWKCDSENGYKVGFVLRKLFFGEIFDYGRKFLFIIVGVVVGLVCVCFIW